MTRSSERHRRMSWSQALCPSQPGRHCAVPQARTWPRFTTRNINRLQEFSFRGQFARDRCACLRWLNCAVFACRSCSVPRSVQHLCAVFPQGARLSTPTTRD
jgi:hypothetical protein